MPVKVSKVKGGYSVSMPVPRLFKDFSSSKMAARSARIVGFTQIVSRTLWPLALRLREILSELLTKVACNWRHSSACRCLMRKYGSKITNAAEARFEQIVQRQISLRFLMPGGWCGVRLPPKASLNFVKTILSAFVALRRICLDGLVLPARAPYPRIGTVLIQPSPSMNPPKYARSFSSIPCIIPQGVKTCQLR